MSVWRCTLAPDGTWRALQLLLPGVTGPPASWTQYNELEPCVEATIHRPSSPHPAAALSDVRGDAYIGTWTLTRHPHSNGLRMTITRSAGAVPLDVQVEGYPRETGVRFEGGTLYFRDVELQFARGRPGASSCSSLVATGCSQAGLSRK